MKKNILSTFMAMTAAVTMLACEEIPQTGTSSGEGEEQEQPEDPDTDQEPEPEPEPFSSAHSTSGITTPETARIPGKTGKRQS